MISPYFSLTLVDILWSIRTPIVNSSVRIGIKSGFPRYLKYIYFFTFILRSETPRKRVGSFNGKYCITSCQQPFKSANCGIYFFPFIKFKLWNWNSQILKDAKLLPQFFENCESKIMNLNEMCLSAKQQYVMATWLHSKGWITREMWNGKFHYFWLNGTRLTRNETKGTET